MAGNNANPTFRAIRMKNVLSFGPEETVLELQQLNVLIGPNGSGKSNLIEVIDLVRSTVGDFRRTISKGGGFNQWMWKGDSNSYFFQIGTTVDLSGFNDEVVHEFFIGELLDFNEMMFAEKIGKTIKSDPNRKQDLLRASEKGNLEILSNSEGWRDLTPEERTNGSILGIVKDYRNYWEITSLGKVYERIRIYREWQFGRTALNRNPQATDLRNDHLFEDFSNLWMFLQRLMVVPKTKKKILTHLADIFEGASDLNFHIQGNTVQLFLTEGDFNLPATRLSDGTLRYLCLLAILCDPNPPPLICLEEPELGLHPDLVVKVAELLIEASERTQIIVTTHSEMLVDCLSNHVDSVIVCEKEEGQTHFKRLEAEKMKVWLEDYGLGDLWISGKLGGVRW